MATQLAFAAQSAAMRTIEQEALCASRFDGRVLLSGESGVGKQTIARLIHERSHRASGPFVVLDCSGMTDTFEPAWLAPHVPGTTLLLRSIDTLNLRLQSALFRFLDSREARAGAIRVVASSRAALYEAVAAGGFREDLFYRLNSMHLCVPPLRERRQDVPVLLDSLMRAAAESRRCQLPRLEPDALPRIALYSWPGNVRELKQLAERLVNGYAGRKVDAKTIAAGMVPQRVRAAASARAIALNIRVLRTMRARGASGSRFLRSR